VNSNETIQEYVAKLENTIAAYEQDIIRMLRKLEEGTLHVAFCNGNHNARVGTEGLICNCTLGREIKDLRHQVQELTKDKLLLDGLEECLKTEERIDLGYTDAWVESGEYGATLSQGPEEFWVSEQGKVICQNLREAIDQYLKRNTSHV